MKKLISLVLAIVLAIGVGVTAFAATDDQGREKVSRVSIAGPKTVRVDKTITLEGRIYPDDANNWTEEVWSSSNPDVAEVDDYGEVTGYEPGKTTITYKLKDGNRTVKYAEYEITVPGRVTNQNNIDVDLSSSSSSTSSSSTGTATSKPSTEKISAATLTNGVKGAAKRGARTSVTFKGYGSVSAAALQSAQTSVKNAGATAVLINFDTMRTDNAKAVEGRLTIDPAASANLKNDIQLGVYTNASATDSTRTKFEKYFTNDVVIIRAAQKGSYGMNVVYAVKISSVLQSSKNLKLYSYNPDTNAYREVKNSNIYIDKNNYVHFTTNLGDCLVISDGPLARN